MYTGQKKTNESKGKPEQKFEAAYGTIFRISKYIFKEESKNFILVFLLNYKGKKFKNQ
jgi:hypothetical protein